MTSSASNSPSWNTVGAAIGNRVYGSVTGRMRRGGTASCPYPNRKKPTPKPLTMFGERVKVGDVLINSSKDARDFFIVCRIYDSGVVHGIRVKCFARYKVGGTQIDIRVGRLERVDLTAILTGSTKRLILDRVESEVSRMTRPFKAGLLAPKERERVNKLIKYADKIGLTNA